MVERALDRESGTSLQHRVYFYDAAHPLTFQDLISFTYEIGISKTKLFPCCRF